jgi:ribulose-phosphate 3-epimerase
MSTPGNGAPGQAGKLAPSILSADFSCLADSIDRVAGEADLLHVDVMDGHFVPNLTIGPPVVESLRPRTDLFLDCHLMVSNPADLLDDFAKAGADRCIVHVELGDPGRCSRRCANLGVGVGITLNPDTPYDAVEPYLAEVDLLLVMSVNPGFGGQSFIAEVLDKVRAARRDIDARGLASRSRSTAASTSTRAARRRGRRRHPRGGQRDLPRRRPRGRRPDDPRRGVAAGVTPGRSVARAKVLTVSDGVADGTRDDGRARRWPSGSTRGVHGRRRTRGARRRRRGGRRAARAVRRLRRPGRHDGGTGFGPRDLTPRAPRAVSSARRPGWPRPCARPATPTAAVRDALRGRVRHGRAARVQPPGSSGGAVECLEAVLPAVPHASTCSPGPAALNVN